MQGSSVASSLEDKLLCEIWQSEFSPCFLSWTFWFCSLKTGSWFSYIPAWFIKLPSIRSHFFFPLGEYLNLTWRPDLRSAMSEASIFDICWYNKIPKSLCVSRFLMQCLEIVLNGLLPFWFLNLLFLLYTFPTGNALGKHSIISYCFLKTQVPIPAYLERMILENSSENREGLVLSPQDAWYSVLIRQTWRKRSALFFSIFLHDAQFWVEAGAQPSCEVFF